MIATPCNQFDASPDTSPQFEARTNAFWVLKWYFMLEVFR